MYLKSLNTAGKNEYSGEEKVYTEAAIKV